MVPNKNGTRFKPVAQNIYFFLIVKVLNIFIIIIIDIKYLIYRLIYKFTNFLLHKYIPIIIVYYPFYIHTLCQESQ